MYRFDSLTFTFRQTCTKHTCALNKHNIVPIMKFVCLSVYLCISISRYVISYSHRSRIVWAQQPQPHVNSRIVTRPFRQSTFPQYVRFEQQVTRVGCHRYRQTSLALQIKHIRLIHVAIDIFITLVGRNRASAPR